MQHAQQPLYTELQGTVVWVLRRPMILKGTAAKVFYFDDYALLICTGRATFLDLHNTTAVNALVQESRSVTFIPWT